MIDFHKLSSCVPFKIRKNKICYFCKLILRFFQKAEKIGNFFMCVVFILVCEIVCRRIFMEKIQSVCLQAVKDVEPAKEPVNFKAKNDNKESDDKGMRKSTKLMLGATALAATIIAAVVVRKKINPMNKVVKDTIIQPAQKTERVSVIDMSEEQFGEWGKKTAAKLKKIFSKKRDMTNWEKPYDKSKPYETFRYRAKDELGIHSDEKGWMWIEKQYSPSGKELTKAYDKEGNLLFVNYRGDSKFVSVASGIDKDNLYCVYRDDHYLNKLQSPYAQVNVKKDGNFDASLIARKPAESEGMKGVEIPYECQKVEGKLE